jgi:hypothetical protein
MSRLRNNGLSVVAFALFFAAVAGQSVAGLKVHNEEQASHGAPPLSWGAYVTGSDFGEAIFENWESEFLQMGLFVFLTALLVQKGSAESKKPPDEEGAGEEAIDEDPRLHRDDPHAPGPVRRGGWVLKVYENSLSLAFFCLFGASFVLHGITGAEKYSDEQVLHGEAPVGTLEYMRSARFWEESLQNWQSEYLAVLSIVVLSIYLRQRGSPESKPVHKPHHETGNE